MWQHTADGPTHIYGKINYTLALRPQGQLVEQVVISKRTCNVSHENVPEDPSELHPEPKRKKQQSNETVDAVTENGPEKEKEDEKSDDESLEDESNESDEDDQVSFHGKILKIHFKDSKLKAYRKTDVFINIIFVDQITSARLVSVHQENMTLVMTSEDPVHSLNASWSWDKEKKTRGLIY